MGADKISSSRNNGLEFYRFIFSLIICLLHFRSGTLFQSQPTAFYGGYLAVDFFFIASGYFLAENFLKKSDGNSFVAAKEKMMWEFLHKKVLRLYPAYFCALVLSAFIKVVFLHNLSVKELIKSGIWEVLMLTGLGFPSVINGVFWFVSALLIGSAVIYWLLLTYQNTFCKFGSLALALIIYAQIYQRIGYLDIVFDWGFLLTWGTWRGIAGLSLGCFLFYVKTSFKPLHTMPAWVITGAEIFLFIVTLSMMWRTRRDIKDFVMILVLSGLFLCIVSEKSRFSKMLNRPISGYLGKLSYAIYVNQVPFLLLFKNCCSAMHTNELAYWKATTVFLACVVAFSIITTELLGKLQPRVLRLKVD